MRRFKFVILGILIIILNLSCGHRSPDSNKNDNLNNNCSLDPKDPIHFDPYYNGHLRENFDPKQIDFSNEYLHLRLKNYNKNKLNQFIKYNFSSIWITSNEQQNGVLGLNYQRIQFHIDKVYKNRMSNYSYIIKGESKVNNNICDFKGELKLLSASFYSGCDDTSHTKCGNILATYCINEDSLQKNSGFFKGVTECSIFLDTISKTVHLDESANAGDGYWNRSFVGTWTGYKTNQTLKCIWGDGRLPFTFDFDCGDGEMMVNDKYVKNGWQTYGDGSEYVDLGNSKFEIKNKWWLQKKE